MNNSEILSVLLNSDKELIIYRNSDKNNFEIYTDFAEKINLNIDVIQNKKIVENICSKINIIYKQIKQNEIVPESNYLFNGLEKSNLDKSISKLDMMDKFLSN